MKIYLTFVFVILSQLLIFGQESNHTIVKSPVKKQIKRKQVLSAEAGIRTLGGFGFNYSYFFNGHLACDIGLGYATERIKVGLQGRLNFTKDKFTPCIYFGLSALPGKKDVPINGIISSRPIGSKDLYPLMQFRTGAGIDWNLWEVLNLRVLIGYQWITADVIMERRYIRRPFLIPSDLVTDTLLVNGLSVSINFGFEF